MKKLQLILVIVFATLISTYSEGQVKKPVAKSPVAVKKSPGIRIKLTTDSGVIIIRLYDSTPLHRDNFVKLVNAHFFDSLLFHRVIKGFMIQGGDPLSKDAQPGQQLGMGGGDMARIPAEFKPGILHKKGVLAAARDGNPEKASSACQFYLVQGKICSDAELNQVECNIRQTDPGFYYTDEQRKMYKTIGGTPFLDMNYTVFGEVEKGMEVIDKIASVPTLPGDRPVGDIRMKMEVIK
ncbi:MAG: peptidylprolyl isomerase [Bacteroidetes bacterium]|nr:peptidylprolyl isomerase [Bacteroidota bacterium]